MALLFVDGFDAGDYMQKWTLNAGGGRLETNGRFGGRNIYSWNDSGVTKTFTPSTTTIVGFAYQHSYQGVHIIAYLNGDSGTTNHINLRWTTATNLAVWAGGAYRINANVPIPNGYWLYIELKATINDTTGTLELRIDGQTVGSFTGDTKNGGTATKLDTFQLATSTFKGMFDDVYIANGTGSAPQNDFLGDIRVRTIVPNGAGSSTQFTPSTGANYSTVDELPFSATDYVTGAAGQTDLYNATDLPAGVGTILGVQANAVVKKTDSGTLSGRTVIKSGTTTVNGTATALNPADKTFSDVYALNPDSSSAWTETDVNNLEIGVGGV